MAFLVNELSFHGQFLDLTSFKIAIDRLMKIRNIVRRFGREVHCHRNLAQTQISATMSMPQAIANLTIDQQRAFRSWITQHGPFWDEARQHTSEDYLEFNGDVVTDTSIGEAAWCKFQGIERELISIFPSNWKFTPIQVDWLTGEGLKKSTQVANHWNDADLEFILRNAPAPLLSWSQLEQMAVHGCLNLTFSSDAFSYLNGCPFVPGAANSLLSILKKLDRFKVCFDNDGQRTAEGHEIYQDFFTGVKEGGGHGATFTDSSDDEKIIFKNKLTFKHPADGNKTLFCTWHGKVQTPQMRVHFSYPIRAAEPLYIVYVGPKLTKR